MQETFINQFILTLNGKIPVENIRTVKELMTVYFIDYDISPKCTDIKIQNETHEELKRYLFSRSIEGIKDSSLEQYQRVLSNMLLFLDKPVESIKTEDIRYYLYKLKTVRQISDRTLEVRRTYINAFFSWLVDNEYIVKNPCNQIKPIKVPYEEQEPLTGVEMERLRNACTTLKQKAVIEFLYSTACRISELCDVKMGDLDLENRTVKLHGKGSKERISYISDRCFVAVTNYLNKFKFEPVYLFGTSKGTFETHTKVSVENYQGMLRKLGKKAGIKDSVHPHRIRHTSATDAVSRGMTIEECRVWLGHESIETTRIYVKVNRDNVKTSHSKYIA